MRRHPGSRRRAPTSRVAPVPIDRRASPSAGDRTGCMREDLGPKACTAAGLDRMPGGHMRLIPVTVRIRSTFGWTPPASGLLVVAVVLVGLVARSGSGAKEEPAMTPLMSAAYRGEVAAV